MTFIWKYFALAIEFRAGTHITTQVIFTSILLILLLFAQNSQCSYKHTLQESQVYANITYNTTIN